MKIIMDTNPSCLPKTMWLAVLVTLFFTLNPISSGSNAHNSVEFPHLMRLVRELSVPASQEEKRNLIFNEIKKKNMKAKSFKYIDTLYRALERETKRLDEADDDSNLKWAIYGRKPDDWARDPSSLENCTVGFKTIHRPKCKLSRVEYLIPLKHRSSDDNATAGEGIIEVNGQTFHSTLGTVQISRAAIFDLTDLFINKQTKNEGITTLTIKASPCHFSHPRRSMLYEYCNINKTTLERFWTLSGERKPAQQRVEFRSETGSHITDIIRATYPKQVSKAVLQPNSVDDANYDNKQAGEEEKHFMSKRDRSKKKGRGLSTSRKRRQTKNRKMKKDSFVPVIEKCQRKPLRIFFREEISFNHIMRPTEVDIGFCDGSCIQADKFTIVDRNLTAHAVILNIAKTTEKRKTRCVPDKMATMSVILPRDGGLVLENLYHALVKTCRCV